MSFVSTEPELHGEKRKILVAQNVEVRTLQHVCDLVRSYICGFQTRESPVAPPVPIDQQQPGRGRSLS